MIVVGSRQCRDTHLPRCAGGCVVLLLHPPPDPVRSVWVSRCCGVRSISCCAASLPLAGRLPMLSFAAGLAPGLHLRSSPRLFCVQRCSGGRLSFVVGLATGPLLRSAPRLCCVYRCSGGRLSFVVGLATSPLHRSVPRFCSALPRCPCGRLVLRLLRCLVQQARHVA